MRRVWNNISLGSRRSLSQHLLIQQTSSRKPKTLTKPFLLHSPIFFPNPSNHLRFLLSGFVSSSPNSSHSLVPAVGDSSTAAKNPISEVLSLRDELIRVSGDIDAIHRVLEDEGLQLFLSSSDGSKLVELLKLLYPVPCLAVQVFDWRRKHDGLFSSGISAEEYVKGITVAGKARKVDLAVEFFTEAANNNVKTSSTYNALMSAYMSNGLPERCQSLFETFKGDGTCIPNIATYNILISLFGRMMLVHDMEETLEQVYASNLSPNVSTFNKLIAGYITAWMWDRVENAYERMKTEFIEPDNETHLLMIRAYSHSGNLRKMEMMYELVEQDVIRDNLRIIETMISAYYKSSSADRVEKIEALLKLFPNEEYSPSLNVLLIRLYAEEQLLEKMEKYIDVAFEHRIAVTSVSAMRAVATAYYQINDVDRLATFLNCAESNGWRLCASLYRCKMIMYRTQNRLEEMENVLSEMKALRMRPTRETLEFLCDAYLTSGHRCKLEQVAGLMLKRAFGIPMQMQ